MRILADKNIPSVTEVFSDIGEVTAVETPLISSHLIREADILIIRSETSVNERLLNGSPVRFVGSPTAGTDHVDIDFLGTNGIGFASAPGSNSNSVKEYVVAALLAFAVRRRISLRGKTLGVVGVGNIGSKVVKAAEALGMLVLQNDPPLARMTGESRFVPLDRVLEADFLTLHVPLTRDGQDPTYHLFDEPQFSRMKKGAVLLNTARGPVVCTPALKRALRQGLLSSALIDVWENEPSIDIEALSLATIGTAHVAGYSMDGKVAAVLMVREAACRYFGISSASSPRQYLHEPDQPIIRLKAGGLADEAALHGIVRQAYDVEEDDAQLRVILTLPEEARAAHFSHLRTGYSYRREFSNFTVELPPEYARLSATLMAIGFTAGRSGNELHPPAVTAE